MWRAVIARVPVEPSGRGSLLAAPRRRILRPRHLRSACYWPVLPLDGRSTVLLVTCLLVALVIGLVVQAQRHQRSLGRIPLRIHVNGSRGKSSVTRLIAAGLRAGGIRTIAKTTGTKPRFIYADGSEVPVVRAGSPNIIEQVRIVRRAAQLDARALVVECMAVKPELQSLLED